jgi:uncharacterized protein
MWLHIIEYILLIILLLVALFANILTLPGLWFMAGIYGIYAWFTGWNHFVGWPSFGSMLVLAAIGEVIELSMGGAITKRAGASKRGMLGGAIGAVIGGIFLTALIPIFIVGTVIGVCLGAALGAGIVELLIHKDVGHSVRVGTGAFKGRLMGIVGKVFIGAIMLIVAVIGGFPR